MLCIAAILGLSKCFLNRINMNIIGVIPARWGSTRLPGKSLVNLCGKPMVQWVVERAMEVRSLSRVIVATDDERIKNVVESFGGVAVMTRVNHPSGTDRIAEAVEGFPNADLVVNLQGDEPLLDPAMVDKLIELMVGDSSWDMGTAATLITVDNDLDDPSVVKVVWDENHRALYFSRSLIPFVRDDDIDVNHWRHLGLYVYRDEFLKRMVAAPPCELEKIEKLEQLRALHLGAKMVVVETDDKGIGVDTPADIERAERLLRKAENNG